MGTGLDGGFCAVGLAPIYNPTWMLKLYSKVETPTMGTTQDKPK